MAAAAGDVDDLTASFDHFCKVSGKPKMTNKAWAKMTKDAKVQDKKFTSTDVDIIWAKIPAKGQKEIDFATFKKQLKDVVAPEYKKKHGTTYADDEAAYKDLVAKISSAKPKIDGTKQSKTGNVDGMTDASKYTGSHKERFDADGKGKGIEGRADVAKNDGYVGNYKGDGTFDEKKK